MARAKPEPTPAQAFLEPVARLALRDPGIEGLVFWHDGGWPDEPSEELEAEEIAFYAEGLLVEGFRLEYRIVGTPDAPDAPDHVQIFVWEASGHRPPESGPDWPLIRGAVWDGPVP